MASGADVLRELTKEKHVDVVRDDGTKKLIVPKDMKLSDAIKWLKRQQAAEETDISFVRDFPYHPADGGYQLAQVLKEKYGWTALVPSGGFFKIPPQLRSIRINRETTVQVPWGNMKVPGIEGTISVGGRRDKETGLLQFQISATIWQRDVGRLEEICDAIVARMPQESIYRGHSIKPMASGDIDFMELTDLTVDDLILPDEVTEALKANLFTPIQYTAAVRDAGVPLKRGILLSGDYGTGKSLTATLCSNLCELNGWTFILVPTPSELVKTLQMAKLYQPALVFCEDIDQIATGGRTEEVNTLLEAVDGVLAKGHEVMLVMTTNRKGKLHGSFLRPGRLDAMIDFARPDKSAALRLVRKYSGDSIGEFDEDLVGDQVEGMIPAAIREVCERSKLHSVSRNPDRPVLIETSDLIHASRSLKAHTRLVEAQNHDEEEEFQKAKVVVGKRFRGVFSNDAELAEEVVRKLDDDD